MLTAIRKFCSSRRLFLSYSSTDRPCAEEIAQSLTLDGHEVFFDRHSLKASDHYGERIRDAIGKADALIYLISRDSVSEGSYTLSELHFAQARWPSPAGRIFPVLIDDKIPIEALPVYLRAVHVLRPGGNIAAEVAAAVHRSRHVRKRCWVLALGLLALFIGLCVWLWTPSSLQRADIALQPIEKVHFRPLQEPPSDTSDVDAPTDWSLSPVTVTLMPIAYNHRTEPGHNARILNESLHLSLGGRIVPYKWMYVVEISTKRCADWLCVTRPVGPATLEPGRTSEPRETMFLPAGSESISWREFFDYVMSAQDPQLAVTLHYKLDLPTGSGSVEVTRETVCYIDVEKARSAFSSLGYSLDGNVDPPFMQSPCLLSPPLGGAKNEAVPNATQDQNAR